MIPVDYPQEISARPPPWSPRAPRWCRARWTWRWSSSTSCRSCCSPPSRPRSCTQSAPYWWNKLNLFWSCYGVAKIKFPLFSFSLITLERSQCAVLRIRKHPSSLKYWNQNQFITSASTIFLKGKLKIWWDLLIYSEWCHTFLMNQREGGVENQAQ